MLLLPSMLLLKVSYESVIQALQSLKANKLRTFLSLLGISIGIFCIISVLAAVNSLERTIKEGFGELGSETIIVDIFPWSEDPGQNYWKYIKRPAPSFRDYEEVKKKLKVPHKATFAIYVNGRTIKYKSSSVQGAYILGSTHEFPEVQTVDIEKGRYFTQNEYNNASNKVILGAKIANELFLLTDPIGKSVKLFGQKFQVIGVMKEEGDNPFNFISYDECTWITYNTVKKFIDTEGKGVFDGGKVLYVKGKEGVETDELKESLRGTLRSIRKLKPREEDNFSLNQVSVLESVIDNVFGVVYLAGSFIGFFALLVGMVSVANIMFVSVKERTNIIGIKKALGAKKFIILLEFLIEAIILCIIGGLIGLGLVQLVLKIVSAVTPIEFYASPKYMLFGVACSIIVGMIAGMIPAYMASRMDPVEAIRQ